MTRLRDSNFTTRCTCTSLCITLLIARILNLVHDVDKSETEILQTCAQHLKKLSQYSSAAEVFEKLGDYKALVSLYIETQQWNYVSII